MVSAEHTCALRLLFHGCQKSLLYVTVRTDLTPVFGFLF